MPKICYTPKRFNQETLKIIATAESICRAYEIQGFSLTLRQLYYQFVARGYIDNKDTEYKRLGSIINDARLAGLIDWHHIEDRTRNLRGLSHWTSPSEIINGAAHSYRLDKWACQPVRMEAWIEKDALIGVLERVCNSHDVPFFSCRGYTSQSEVWGAAQRIAQYLRSNKNVVILHLGDHDPSGVDMSRDIADRLAIFLRGAAVVHDDMLPGDPAEIGELLVGGLTRYIIKAHGGRTVEIRRIALSMTQVGEHDPPPNPAKITDSRCNGYIAQFGEESWELDALPPNVIENLVASHICASKDEKVWDQTVAKEEKEREVLTNVSARWSDVVEWLG